MDYTLIKKTIIYWPPNCSHAKFASELRGKVVRIPESSSALGYNWVWQVPSVPVSKKCCHSWWVFVKHFDKPAYSNKWMFCWQGLFCCKIHNGQEQDFNLEGYCFHMSRADLLFTWGIFFSSLCKLRTCQLPRAKHALSQMRSCLGTCNPSGPKICCIYDTDSYLCSQRTNALVPPFVAILANVRADCSPGGRDLPRSQGPVVQDCRSKFSFILKAIKVN